MTVYLILGLTSFPRTAENPATTLLPSLIACSHTCIPVVSLPACDLAALVWKALLAAYLLIPYSRLNAHWLSPAWILETTSSRIPMRYFFMPFFPDITIPPDVVIILHQGAFCLLSVFTGSVHRWASAFLFTSFQASSSSGNAGVQRRRDIFDFWQQF